MNTAAQSLLALNVRSLTDAALQAMADGRDWASQVARDELTRRRHAAEIAAGLVGCYVLCSCASCAEVKAAETARHQAGCRRTGGEPCRSHALDRCHCDCPR